MSPKWIYRHRFSGIAKNTVIHFEIKMKGIGLCRDISRANDIFRVRGASLLGTAVYIQAHQGEIAAGIDLKDSRTGFVVQFY
jgi:hypothetical protein